MVLAVAHPIPWSSASFYLPSQSLTDSRCNLHATSRSSHLAYDRLYFPPILLPVLVPVRARGQSRAQC